MKKGMILFASTLIFLVVIITSSLMIINNRTKFVDEVNDLIVDELTNINSHIKDYKYGNSGTVKIDASYKGAHGESYPSSFEYNFDLLNNVLTLEDIEGYGVVNINKKILSIYSMFVNIDSSKVKDMIVINKVSELDKIIKLDIDASSINKVLGTRFKSTSINIYTKGFIKSLDYYSIKLDDINIVVKDNKIDINSDFGKIIIVKNSNGYSLKLNDNFKMNVFYNKNNVEYNVVINNNVLYFKTVKDNMLVKLSSQSAIYYGLTMDFKFSDVNLNKDKKVENEEIIPLIRYLNNIDYKFWR